MRRLALLLVSAFALSGCGSVSSATALHQWASQSAFSSAVPRLLGDARHAANALRAAQDVGSLHTVCAVLLLDVQAANAALPTPDTQTTTLLSRAYEDLGAGANRCYRADTAAQRARAITSLSRGASELVEARARVRSF